ncbi:cyclase family protein [soil metagenome]
MGCGEVVELLGHRVRLVDLSRPVGPTPSEPNPPRLRHISHEEGAELWEHLFGIPSSALPSGLGFAGETVELSTHAGTHLDAPWHYAPVSEDEPARKVDETPLSRCMGPAIVLDVSDLPTGHLVSAGEVEERLEGIRHDLSPGDIVLFRTGADAVWGTEEYFSYGCGLGRETVLYLVERGVRVMGTDAWSLDRPYPIIGAEWREKEERSLLWPAHYAGIEREYWHLEKLANLGELPATGATLLALPIKVEAASGAWVRAVGLIPPQQAL